MRSLICLVVVAFAALSSESPGSSDSNWLGRATSAAPSSAISALTSSSYVGGAGYDVVTALAVDSRGYVYLAGWTDSPDFPAVNALRPTMPPGTHAFVTKLTPDGTRVVFSTYLGGSGQDRALGLAVDSAGSVYVTGLTTSRNLPDARNLYSGGTDAFLIKLAPSGVSVDYCVYFGGVGPDTANAIALDAAGNAYITGVSGSREMSLNGFQSSNAGQSDAFVAKFSASGILQYATYLGGSGDDQANGIAVDAAGSAYITGVTNSSNLPRLDAIQQTLRGSEDAFVAKFSADGKALVYSTYLGGSAGGIGLREAGTAIVVDPAGYAYVTGTTSSTDFPVVSPIQSSLRGALDVFVTKFRPDGHSLAYSTYVGGSSFDYGLTLSLDVDGSIYVGGYTTSFDVPVVDPLRSSSAGTYDAFLFRLTPAGDRLIRSTYLGGSSMDAITAIVARNGAVYVGGHTQSVDFPLVSAFQPRLSGALDGFASFVYGSPKVTTQVANMTRPGASVFAVGDRLLLTVTGPPNQPVSMTGTFNGAPIGGVFGQTDAFGVFSLSSVVTDSTVGTWVESWCVNGVASDTAVSFTVIPIPVLTFTNLSRPDNRVLQVGDSWRVSLKGLPNRRVSMSGSFNGVPIGMTLGLTDAKGDFSLSGTMGADVIGEWMEEWFVDGIQAPPSVLFRVTPKPTLTFVNFTRGDTSLLHVGDAWQIVLRGAANEPVTMTGAYNNRNIIGSFGKTDSLGVFSISGVMTSGVIGNWEEHWYVGGLEASPAIAFVVK